MSMALQEALQEPIGHNIHICSKHGDIQDMFCMDCEEQICLVCGQQNHESHDWNRNTTFLRRVKSEIEEECNHVRQQKIPLLKAELEKIKTLRDENKKQFMAAIETISSSTEHVVTVLNRLSEDLMGYCKSLHKQTENKLNTNQNEGETCISKLECCLNEVEARKTVVDLVTSLKLKKDIKCILYQTGGSEFTHTDLERWDHIEFLKGNIDENILRSALGIIYQSSNNVTVSKIFEAKKGTKLIKYISPISEYRAWFREFQSLTNILIDIKSDFTEIDKSGRTFSDPIPEDFITLENEVSFYTWHSGHSVMKIYPAKIKASEITSSIEVKLADLSPLFPVGICKTVAGRFLVSATDTKLLASEYLIIPKKSVIIVLSKNGKTKNVFQWQNDGEKPLFRFPYRLAENTNGDICVVDRLDTLHGQMVVLSSSGEFKFHYRGTCPKRANFDPRGVCCDSLGHILLSDFGNKCVHLIDHDGTFLTYLIRTSEETSSVSLNLNQLWIGGKNGIIYVYRYEVDTT